jgi:hypothetical protein
MMYRSHLLSAIFCLCVLLWPDDLQAGAIESSYRNARDILDQALLFTGADQWQHSQQPLLIEASGTLYPGAEHQGYTANDPTPSEFHETWAYQPATGRIGREYRQKRPDGSDEWIREIFPSTGLQTLYFPDSGQSINLAGPSSDLSRRRNLRRFPPLLRIPKRSGSLETTDRLTVSRFRPATTKASACSLAGKAMPWAGSNT